MGGLVEHLGIPAPANALHRAAVDCDLLLEVIQVLLERVYGKGSSLLKVSDTWAFCWSACMARAAAC